MLEVRQLVSYAEKRRRVRGVVRLLQILRDEVYHCGRGCRSSCFPRYGIAGLLRSGRNYGPGELKDF
jgi:hypothetical protein